ncbi:hypothetical protein EJ06DRAFT_141581 [Trichodelitschia bisporula]|uniref:Uncharacterized protein n=1 Tax=Trichodelitschia bisporula TaxID=703511 RepID=A0A6G1HP69_9PEZI|nr:hypothetical protein EJ06DRAFT_141581 [Trichodelitschia bisporula]
MLATVLVSCQLRPIKVLARSLCPVHRAWTGDAQHFIPSLPGEQRQNANTAESVPDPSEPRPLSYAVGMDDVITRAFGDGDAQDGQDVEGPRAPPGTPVAGPPQISSRARAL